MKRRSRKKKKHLIKHSLKRYFERYKQEIDENQILAWNGDIKKNRDNVKLIEKQSLTRSLYLINSNIYAIYNHNLKCICTIFNH